MTESIKLLEFPDIDSINVCVYVEHDDVFALGERIHARFSQAYMNGYNWDALIQCYVSKVDPDLMQEVESDPEAGMVVAYMRHSSENLEKMKRFEAHIRELLQDEASLFQFIEQHLDDIDWQ